MRRGASRHDNTLSGGRGFPNFGAQDVPVRAVEWAVSFDTVGLTGLGHWRAAAGVVN
jgi:hypothetical protein